MKETVLVAAAVCHVVISPGHDMSENILLTPVARIYNDFIDKFGVPRQSGLVNEVLSVVVFEEKYRNGTVLRGIEGFSHIWLLWRFSQNKEGQWSDTVRPPRLGGNIRMGVFATRSPFRPNPIGLSCVKLEKVCKDSKFGPVLYVSGADMVNNTPIYDIKPYLPSADSHPEARGGFTACCEKKLLDIKFDDEILSAIPEEKRTALCRVLAEDPRPAYHNDPSRVYKMSFSDYEIGFTVDKNELTIRSAEKRR